MFLAGMSFEGDNFGIREILMCGDKMISYSENDWENLEEGADAG